MSDLSLLQVFLALYLFECVLRVPKGKLAFVKGLWGAYRRCGPGWEPKPPLPGGAALLCDEKPGWQAAPPDAEELAAVAAQVAALKKPAATLNRLGNLLLAALAGLLLAWRQEPGPWRAEALLALLALSLLLHGALVGLLNRAWRLGLPRVPGRRLAVAVVSLSPWASSRCADLLWRDALRGAHPMAAALALLPAAESEAWAQDRLRRAHSGPAADAGAESRWRAFMQAQGWDVEAALRAPVPDAGARAWCPCCRTQYRDAARCHDCGIGLAGFP
jgi:hypothetical protein